MPLYDYACTSCGHRVEVLHGRDDPGPTACDVCGGQMRKVVGAPNVHFKGSGWAKRDRAASRAGPASEAAAGKGTDGAESKVGSAAAGDAAGTAGSSTADASAGSSGGTSSDEGSKKDGGSSGSSSKSTERGSGSKGSDGADRPSKGSSSSKSSTSSTGGGSG
jgi:putative FmdB family regulatory protein